MVENLTWLWTRSKEFKAKIKDVFSRSYCCYGNQLCHKFDSNIFTNDWAVSWYHDFGINGYRVAIMTHQSLRLKNCRKLLRATLNLSWSDFQFYNGRFQFQADYRSLCAVVSNKVQSLLISQQAGKIYRPFPCFQSNQTNKKCYIY